MWPRQSGAQSGRA